MTLVDHLFTGPKQSVSDICDILSCLRKFLSQICTQCLLIRCWTTRVHKLVYLDMLL